MMHRTLRSAARWLPVLAVLLAGTPLTAQTPGTVIRFADIETLARNASPRARIIEQQRAWAGAARDRALQWSNPALAYDHEEADGLREWQITLGKRFERPFSQGALRDGWDHRVQAAELQAAQATADLLTDLRADYVRLSLARNHRGRLDGLAGLVRLAAEHADRRHAAGELAGTERQLVRLAAYGLEASALEVSRGHDRLEARWRADMGLAAHGPLELATPVTYMPVALDDAASYVASLAAQPGHRSRETMALGLERQAQASRPGLVPAVEIYGGYKRFAAEDEGIVAGVALDLPFFDRSGGESAAFTARRLMVESEHGAATTRAVADTRALVGAIRDAGVSLAAFEPDSPLTDSLLVAYREGSLTLDAFLGAIQIQAAALGAYFAELAAYYDNIFRLETMTGATIVRFVP